jgi:hypothetical protein
LTSLVKRERVPARCGARFRIAAGLFYFQEDTMSERFQTYLTVSGPDAAAAQEAAIDAIKNASTLDNHWGGCWVETKYFNDGIVKEESKYYFDHDSGQGAVIIVTEVSRRFPSETFHLRVDGSFGEGAQGTVEIQNGNVADRRSEAISYGETDNTSMEDVLGTPNK